VKIGWSNSKEMWQHLLRNDMARKGSSTNDDNDDDDDDNNSIK
jgi:hypothetical protein